MDAEDCTEFEGIETALSVESVENVVTFAHLNAKQLQAPLASVEDALAQVSESAATSEHAVVTAFSAIRDSVLKALERREMELVEKVKQIRDEALKPLHESRDLIQEKLLLAQDIVDLGKKMSAATEARCIEVNKRRIFRQSSSIGSVPEVPSVCDIPNISVHLDRKWSHRWISQLNEFGNVFVYGPVRIIDWEERPGAVIIYWEETDEYTSKDGPFLLQYCSGNSRKTTATPSPFFDAYLGRETSFTLRDLKPNNEYTVRICLVDDAERIWSTSIVISTTLAPFEWESDNHNYSFTDGQRIATKTGSEAVALHSSGPQFHPRHSLQFKILETDDTNMDEGLGLTFQRLQPSTSPVKQGVLLVNLQGEVYVNGVPITTRLPQLQRGSKISIESEELPNGKLRVMVESGGKQISYDWKVTETSGQGHLVGRSL